MGNYDDYLEKKDNPLVSGSSGGIAEADSRSALDASEPSASNLSYQQQKQQRALERKRQNDIAKLEKRIDEIETRQAELDDLLTDEAICTDVAKLMEINQEKEALDEELLELMEKWEALSLQE